MRLHTGNEEEGDEDDRGDCCRELHDSSWRSSMVWPSVMRYSKSLGKHARPDTYVSGSAGVFRTKKVLVEYCNEGCDQNE